MKKLISLFAVFAISAVTAFANVEISHNLSISPIGAYAIQMQDDTSIDGYYLKIGDFKAENEFNFFFGSPLFMDIGLNLRTGLGVFTCDGFEYDGDTETDSTFGISYSMAMGPSVRFNINNRHSFIASCDIGGYMCTNSILLDDDDIEHNMWGITVEDQIGYRFWIVNKTGFHFGLACNANYSIPVYGSYSNFKSETETPGYSADFDVTGGSVFTVSFGLVFNFGDRGYDKNYGNKSADTVSENTEVTE